MIDSELNLPPELASETMNTASCKVPVRTLPVTRLTRHQTRIELQCDEYGCPRRKNGSRNRWWSRSCSLLWFFVLADFQGQSRKQSNQMWQRNAHRVCRDDCFVQNSKLSCLGLGVSRLVALPSLPFDDVLLGTAGISRSASAQDRRKS